MNITQEDINTYVEHGGDLGLLTYKEIAKVPQESFNKYVEHGGDLGALTHAQRTKIPQESFNKYVEHGDLLWDPTTAQLFYIPQEYINKRAENGYSLLKHFTTEQMDNIPQESCNKRIENGGSPLGLENASINIVMAHYFVYARDVTTIFTDEEIADFPQEFINERAANGRSLSSIPQEKIDAIPKSILKISDNAKESLILYGTGKIGSDELPDDIYVNNEARRIFLSIAKLRVTNSFNTICKKSGYTDNIPNEVVADFNSRLKEMKKWIQKKKKEGLKNLLNAEENKKNDAIDEINGMR